MNYQSKGFHRIRNWLICCGFFICLGLSGLNGQAPVAASGDRFSAVIDASGNLFTFGANGAGQLGVSDAGDFSADIQQVQPAEEWAAVAVSRGGGDRAHILAIQKDGSLWAWGANDRGQLGIDSFEDQAEPALVNNTLQWVEVAAGREYSMALTNDGEIYIWGDNTFGQLGRPIADAGPDGLGVPNSAENSTPFPELLDGNTYLGLAAGDTTGFGIREEGTQQNLYSWGYSQSLQLGLANGQLSETGPLAAPIRVGTRTDWSDVFAGSDMSFGIANGYLYAWGAGAFSQDGLAPGAAPKTPTQVASSDGWASLSVGETHVLALKTDGTLYGWGNNQQGQLGLPLRDSSGRIISANQNISTPQILQPGSNFSAVGAGDGFSIIFSDSGFLLASGIDDAGQLADGTASSGITDGFESSSLGLSDLVAASVIVTGEATPGSPLNVILFLRNDGTGPIEEDFEIDAVLSTRSSFSGLGARDVDFIVDGSTAEAITVTTDFGPGESVSLPVTIDLASPIDQGSYFLVFKADTSAVLEEVTTSNNTVALDPADVLDFAADLSVASIMVTADDLETDPVETFPLSPGAKVQIEVVIENTGKGAIPAGSAGAFDLRLFLAPSQTITPGVIDLIEALNVNSGIAGNDTFTVSLTGADALNLPVNLPLGDYFLGVDIDVNEDIDESEEANNSGFSSMPLVEVDGIELEEALDTNLFTTPVDFNFLNNSTPAGLPNWFGQSAVSFDGVDAAKSPPISAGQRATLFNTTSVSDALLVTYRWKADTSSSENYLFFGLNGVEVDSPDSRISGSTDWVEVTQVVPVNAQMGWTYVQGVEAEDDAVYVDTVSVQTINKPDLIISNVEGQAGSYTLLSDPISLDILLRNQGTSTNGSSGITFDLGIYLSADRVFNAGIDRKVHTITETETITSGANPIYVPTFDLPADLDPGDYYLILVIDETNGVDEGVSGGEANNIFVSNDPDVTIRALPDIQITSEDVTAIPGYYLVGERLDFEFAYRNVGLTGITDPIRTEVVISSDNQAVSGEDFSITEFDYLSGLPADGAAFFDPDFYTIQSGVPLGQRTYIGVITDVAGAIAESNETNNAAVYPGRDFIFSEITVEEAFELDREAIQEETAPFLGDLPWFGQKEVSFTDGDAAQSLDIGNNEVSAFQTEITTENDTFVTFHWKVSSELDVETGKGDILAFYVNDLDPDNFVEAIQGDVDWRRVSVFVEAGTHVLRWAYIKDQSISSGADAGWVDNFNFEVPDLVVDSISLAPGNYAPNSTIENFSFSISNNGAADVPTVPPFDIRIILSEDALIGNDGDIELATISDSEGLAIGETRQYGTVGNPLDLVIPGFVSEEGFYYIGVVIDSGQIIPEANENNNSLLSNSAILEITPSINLNEAIDNETSLLDLSVGGVNGWFGVGNVLIGDGSSTTSDGVDAAQSAPVDVGESSYMQITVDDGPKILKYRWKVDSEPNVNRLEFAINGVVQEQISGQVDWDFGFGSFTLELDGETTDPISSVQPGSATLADAIEAALNNLDVFAPEDGVIVTGELPTFTITFLENGNRSPLEFASLSPLLVDSSAINSTNGTAGTSEVQTLTIVPNVTFRLDYQGILTDPLPYTASADDVEAALNDLQVAGNVSLITGGVSVTGSDLDFQVEFNDVGQRDEIRIRTTDLRRPVTLESVVATAGDAGTSQVQSFSISPEVTVFIPAGAQELRWTYRRAAEGGDFEDAGWVDDVSLTDFDGPELELTNVDYAAGEYVLDVGLLLNGDGTELLGTRYLDITVEAANRGNMLPVFSDGNPLSPEDTSNFSAADIEVRLSLDRQYGNGDDIVLGSFAQAEGGLDVGQMLRFIGPLPLGSNIPEGFYYLMAKIDTFALVAADEFSVENNLWIAQERDVQITRLPQLNLVTGFNPLEGNSTGRAGDIFDLDETKVHYAGEPYQFNVTIRNVGLGRVEGSDAFENSVELVGFLKTDLAELLAGDEPPILRDYQGLGTSYPLGDFGVQELLRGRSFDEDTDIADPGDSVSLLVEGFLPTTQRLEAAGVKEEDKPLSDYVFYLRFNVDAGEDIRESDEVKRWDGFDPSEFGFTSETNDNGTPAEPDDDFEEFFLANSDEDGLFEINPVTYINGNSWAASYDGVPSPTPMGIDSDGDGIEDFLEYAFNRNPTLNDSNVPIYGSYGEVTFEGEDYLGVVFDFVALSTDLTYFVVAADDVAFTENVSVLAAIAGPYDQELGPQSLTGDGGLIDGGVLTLGDPTNAEDYVLDVVDYGYGARITVRDSIPISDAPSRFIRIQVE